MQDYNTIKEKVENFLKAGSKIAILVAALLIGAILRDIYIRITQPRVVSTLKFERPKTIQETSISINERGELMMIDRGTGEYRLYQDSVGKVIFNMYAGRIYSNNLAE